jgi:PKD repeat protein
MKKLYFTLLAALLLSVPVLANNVIVKGYVFYSNGTAAANQLVYVSTDSLTTPPACMQAHQLHTNANGFYIDSFSCSSNIVKVRIDVVGCGSVITENPQVNTSTNIIERNFTLSCSPQGCHADFTFMIQQTTAAFTATATVAPGTTIVSYHWNFGDGTNTSTLTPNTLHSYTAPGSYNVSLFIESSGGCRDTIIKSITILNTAGTCHAQFRDSMVQPNKFYFFSGGSTTAPGDSIVQRIWSYGDGTGNNGNYVNTDHIYQVSGTYTVCLRTVSARGCVDSFCKVITAVAPTPPPCHANYTYSISGSGEVHFTNTSTTLGTSAQYYWHFGTLGVGNTINPVFTLPAGTHNVCLAVYSGTCRDSICKTITIAPPPPPTNCVSYFTYENLPFTNPAQRNVRFNSTPSSTAAGDSIISRRWQFGDGTSLTGNVISPVHSYSVAGSYTVCLTIKTALNCEKTECKLVIVTQVNSPCVPHFTWQRTAPKQASFNSSTSWVPVGDTIVQRRWNFGDGAQLLTGNVVSPVHTYAFNGVYTVSLRIITTNHCEQTVTMPVILQDSMLAPPTAEPIKIISLFPNPAQAQTQTVIWSLHNNVQAELAIYDVYGTKKWSMNKILLQGNNMTIVPTAYLVPGPYYFKVTTTYGVKSRPFFKR